MEGNTQQLELFSGSGKPYQAGGDNRSAFISHIRGYEKIILLVIGAIVIAVVAFSLGVEKGKGIALKADAPAPAAVAVISQRQVLPQKAPGAEMPGLSARAAVPVAEKPRLQGYTIQLASFQGKDAARKEADLLKKSGMPAVVISKGSYSIVCVGSFTSKEAAEPLLAQLKKKYQDSFIRRL